MADVKVVRGAETGSDHYLMIMKVNLKLRKPTYPEAAAQPKLRVSRLKKREVRRKFQLDLDASFKQSRCKVEEGVTNTQKG